MTVVLLLAACAVDPRPDDGGQFGEENGAGCVPVERTPLAPGEVSPLGFAPDAVASLLAPAEVPLAWADGAATSLALAPTPDGPAEFVVYAWETGGAAEPAATDCPDRVELPYRIGFATGDGAFDELLAVRVGAVAAARAEAYAALGDPAGTFDVDRFAPQDNDYEEVAVHLTLGFSATGPDGVVSGQGSGREGDVAFSEQFPIATWGAAAE